jgi:hypothetical protein
VLKYPHFSVYRGTRYKGLVQNIGIPKKKYFYLKAGTLKLKIMQNIFSWVKYWPSYVGLKTAYTLNNSKKAWNLKYDCAKISNLKKQNA